MGTATSKLSDDVIDVTEVVAVKRGRKVELDPAVTAALDAIPAGKAGRLSSTFGPVSKDDRGKVSQSIRKHFRHLDDGADFAIAYSPEGVPQVIVRSRSN